MLQVLTSHTSKLPKKVLKNTKNMTPNSCSVRPEKFYPYIIYDIVIMISAGRLRKRIALSGSRVLIGFSTRWEKWKWFFKHLKWFIMLFQINYSQFQDFFCHETWWINSWPFLFAKLQPHINIWGKYFFNKNKIGITWFPSLSLYWALTTQALKANCDVPLAKMVLALRFKLIPF